MIFNLQDVIRDIRVCLDLNMTDAPLLALGDVDTLSLDDIITSKVEEAVNRVHSTAPVYMLENGHNLDDNVCWADQCSGWLLLPPDFMRLISFEMSDWERPVYQAIGCDNPKYALQRQPIKALRGTRQKPVCAIAVRPEGRVIEFYSCDSEDAYLRRGQYIPYAHIDSSGGIDISERCYTAVVYMAASLVLTTIGEVAKATALADKSMSWLQ